MESLIFALNAVLPIMLTMLTGYLLKRIGLIKPEFCRTANKLVFRLFLPCLLFLNIYNIESFSDFKGGFVIYGAAALVGVFLLGFFACRFVTDKGERRGVLTQGTFRSNYALIGIPLAASLFGEEGTAAATLMSAVSVPMLNVLAVISLSVYSGGGKKPSVLSILKDIAKNPLLQSIFAGVVCVLLRDVPFIADSGFRASDIAPLFALLRNLSSVATPLALISLGAQFDFSAVGELKKEIIFGTLMRTVAVPVLGIGCAWLFFRGTFGGEHFATFVALFATPVAVSSVPMTQEMGGDTVLAGQLVVWTTAVSAFTVFLCAFILRSVGIF